MKERCRETADFLRASLEDVDEITLYQRSSYWDEFEPVVSIPADSNPGTLPAEHPLVKQVSAVLKPIVPEKQGGGSTSLIPLMDPNNTQTPLLGFLWVTSKLNPKAFSPHILLLLDTVAVQFAETLLRHRLQEDQEAQARLKQGRQSYTV
ncbi:MAG: hypothetical protein A2992_05360 [Elusimicrobia bacterium RIFCSPLOWO2_01_FULL_59_12]|nr:MAG: hypothetical protein A2992_05360 [Elusimicrobia bacterium RIFCSPLOWO2_01_FULL_59_12]